MNLPMAGRLVLMLPLWELGEFGNQQRLQAKHNLMSWRHLYDFARPVSPTKQVRQALAPTAATSLHGDPPKRALQRPLSYSMLFLFSFDIIIWLNRIPIVDVILTCANMFQFLPNSASILTFWPLFTCPRLPIVKSSLVIAVI